MCFQFKLQLSCDIGIESHHWSTYTDHATTCLWEHRLMLFVTAPAGNYRGSVCIITASKHLLLHICDSWNFSIFCGEHPYIVVCITHLPREMRQWFSLSKGIEHLPQHTQKNLQDESLCSPWVQKTENVQNCIKTKCVILFPYLNRTWLFHKVK